MLGSVKGIIHEGDKNRTFYPPTPPTLVKKGNRVNFHNHYSVVNLTDADIEINLVDRVAGPSLEVECCSSRMISFSLPPYHSKLEPTYLKLMGSKGKITAVFCDILRLETIPE